MLTGSEPSSSTQPEPVEQAQTSILTPYEGMRVYARGLALSGLVLDDYLRPLHGPEKRGWGRHPRVPSVWVNPRYPDHIAHHLGEDGAWRFAQRVRECPSLPALQLAADSFVGEPAQLESITVFPRALRTRMRLAPDSPWTFGTSPVRCRRFGRKIQGYEVELRLSRTTSSSGKHTFYAEAFVLRHETEQGKARAMLYLADARWVARVADDEAVQFIAELLDALFLWVYELEREGIVPDDRRLHLPQIATAHSVEAVGEVYFDATLPEPSGTRRIATRASGGFMPMESDADLALLLASVEESPTLLARPGFHSRVEIAGWPSLDD